MIVRFIQGVRNDDLIQRLHGKDSLPTTIEELMVAARAFVSAEKLVKGNQELEKKDHKRGKDDNDRGRFEGKKRFRQGSARV